MKKKIALIALAFTALTNVGFVKAATTPNQQIQQNNGAARIKVTMTGTIQTIGADGMTLVIRVGNRNVTINTSNAKMMNAKGMNSTFSQLKVGDRVTVMGTAMRIPGVSVSSMSATTIRDLSR